MGAQCTGTVRTTCRLQSRHKAVTPYNTHHFASKVGRRPTSEEKEMLHYTVVFLVIALIAALFGFGGIAAGAASIAKILFFVFVIMAVASFLLGVLRKG